MDAAMQMPPLTGAHVVSVAAHRANVYLQN
jgi:hypothetical protein